MPSGIFAHLIYAELLCHLRAGLPGQNALEFHIQLLLLLQPIVNGLPGHAADVESLAVITKNKTRYNILPRPVQ